ncbi:MAG: hypothetical protein AMXMBFR84_01080 [Candidatus Hydrogenedentota bacterium]
MDPAEALFPDLVIGLVIIAVSLPLILNKIPPNHFYGVRIPKAFESERNWYDINAYGGRALCSWGAVILLAAFAKNRLAAAGVLDGNLITLALPVFACVAAAIIQILWYARKL